jgi:molybdate transport system ATP-binding protein
MPDTPLVILEDASVARPGNPAILHGVTWTLREGETWAIVGPMGSGKTTLAETVYGRHGVVHGSIAWPLVERLREAGRKIAWAAEVMQFVSFKEESRLFSYAGHYYQQRFEFADEEEPLSLDDFLHAGNQATETDIAAVTARLGIANLRPLSFIKLSNGQVRRSRIARALLGKPELLILDDPFIGLDIAGRAELDHILGELVQHGERLVLVARRDAVPAWVTHVLELNHGGVEKSGLRSSFSRDAQSSERSAGESVGYDDSASRLRENIVELRNVNVTHGGKRTLNDVTWTIRAGERWALLGPNGAGKTTLLSILCGDHPQAYANDVRLFGQQRGSGESIWDVKRKVGLVSPELHLYFSGPLTGFEAAVTGYYDVLTYREPTPKQAEEVRAFFTALEATHLLERSFARLSTGEQRLVLLVRALVKRPPLVVLDEPFQGFDTETVNRIREWLDRELKPEQTLIFVSHQPHEIPQSVTHQLEIAGGCVLSAK